MYYNVRDKTRIIADQHADLGRTIDSSIVQHLHKLRAEIKAHIKVCNICILFLVTSLIFPRMSKTIQASSPLMWRRNVIYPLNLLASLQTTYLRLRTHQWVYIQKVIRKSCRFPLLLSHHNRQLHFQPSRRASTETPGT